MVTQLNSHCQLSPGTDILTPGTDILTPGTDILTPGTDILTPGTDILTPGTDILTPGTDILYKLTSRSQLDKHQCQFKPITSWNLLAPALAPLVFVSSSATYSGTWLVQTPSKSFQMHVCFMKAYWFQGLVGILMQHLGQQQDLNMDVSLFQRSRITVLSCCFGFGSLLLILQTLRKFFAYVNDDHTPLDLWKGWTSP